MKTTTKKVILCIAMLLCTAFLTKAQKSNYSTITSQAPGYYKIKIGTYEITVINDGTMLLPDDRLLVGAKPGEIAAALKHNYQTLPVETSMNCFLINTGSKLILVDVGGGDVYRPAGFGKLISNLNAAGYQPEQIDAVLLTHCHVDHSGGLIINGKMAFPNATIYMHQADYDLLFSTAGEKFRSYFTNEVSVITPYKNAQKVKTFSQETELFPGITAIPAPGHTPGHTYYQIISNGQKLLLWGDVVHAPEVQFPDPAVSVQFDLDGDQAKAQRLKVFADAAKNGYLVGGAHISFPGIGHVSVDNGIYSWIPVTYSTGNTAIMFK